MAAVKFVHANQNNLGFVKALEHVNALLHGTRSTKKMVNRASSRSSAHNDRNTGPASLIAAAGELPRSIRIYRIA
jgi:hypothetical protein